MIARNAPTEDSAADGISPQDFDAEQAVLGSILLEPDAAVRAFAIITPDDFYRTYHRQICEAMAAVYAREEPVDLVTVGAELRRRQQLDEVGGGEYLTALINEVPTAAHVPRYANIVAEKAVLRRLIRAGSAIRALGYDNPDNIAETLTRAQAILQPLSGRIRLPDPPMPLTFTELQGAVAETSWTWEGYLPNGALSVLFAPPEAGKSFLGLELMRCVATGADWPDGRPNDNPPEKCLLIDFEGTQGEYLKRAHECSIPPDMLLAQPPDLLPYLTDAASFETFRQWLAYTGARFMVIDSWRDASPGINEDSSGEVAPTLQPLKILARDFDIPILLLHHPTKQHGNSWSMSMADLRGSGAFAAAARVILVIDKPNSSSDSRLCRVVKRNSGPKPEPLGFDIGNAGLVWTSPVYHQRSTPKTDAAKDAIHEALTRARLTYGDLMAALLQRAVTARTGDRALNALEAAGDVYKAADGRYGLITDKSA